MLLTHFISLMIEVSAHNIINTDFWWIGALVMQVIRITTLLKDYKVFRSSIQEIKPFIVGCGVGIALKMILHVGHYFYYLIIRFLSPH